MELDWDRIYALFSIERCCGSNSVFIASAGAGSESHTAWEDTQAITSIEIKQIDSRLLDEVPTGHFDLREISASLVNLKKFVSDAPIRGLDTIAEVSPLTACESVIYCEPGEWFVWPNKWQCRSAELTIDSSRGCFDLRALRGRLEMTKDGELRPQYITTKIQPDLLRADVIEVEYGFDRERDCDVLIQAYEYEPQYFPIHVESHQEFYEKTGQTVWEYLGVRHYNDSRAKNPYKSV